MWPSLLLRNMTRLSRPQRDALAAGLLVGGIYLASWHLDIAEKFSAWAEQYEHLQADELAVALFFSALASAWFSHRRIQDAREEAKKRTLAEHAESLSRQKFRTLFDESLCGNFICTKNGEITLCNAAFNIMSGHPGQNINLADAVGEAWAEIIQKLESSDRITLDQLTVTRPDNAPWVVMASFVLAAESTEDDREIHGFFVDITELNLAEQELAALLEENRALSRHAHQVEEEERRRIAREIHDDMGQYLTAIQLDAATLALHEIDTVTEKSRSIMQHARHIQKTVQGLIQKLRPVVLDEHGLPEAVRHLAAQWGRQHSDTFCSLFLGNCQNLPETVSAVAYRIVQEALTNVARHAHASNVIIAIRAEVTNTENRLIVEVADNGAGFSISGKNNGFGLIGMRERVESLKGTLTINSGSGTGTSILAHLPIPAQETT